MVLPGSSCHFWAQLGSCWVFSWVSTFAMGFFTSNPPNLIHARSTSWYLNRWKSLTPGLLQKNQISLFYIKPNHTCMCISEVFLSHLMTTSSEKSVFIMKEMQSWALPSWGDAFNNSFLLLQESFALNSLQLFPSIRALKANKVELSYNQKEEQLNRH